MARVRAVEANHEPVDAGNEKVPSSSWSGRKPWETDAPGQINAESPFDVLAEDAIEEYRRGGTKKFRRIAEERGVPRDAR